MKRISTVGIAILSVMLFGCGEITSTTTIKLAHGMDVKHPVARGMVFLAEEVDRISGGELQIEIYPSEQLGSERQCLELLQIGSLGMTKVSAAVLENFAPKVRVFGLPYIFRGEEHAWKVFEGEIGRSLLLEPEKYWLRGLCYYDAGSRSFYTKNRPIRSPEDLKGMKVRVMPSQTAMQMVKTMGGAATPIAYGELYTALQQGVVDGAENNPPSFHTSRHYEVCKYYSLNEHTFIPDVLLISTSVWDRLTEQEKTWLNEAVAASVVHQRRLWKASVEEAMRVVQEAGVEVIRPDKAPFAAAVSPIFESYRDEPEFYDLIQQIRAVK